MFRLNPKRVGVVEAEEEEEEGEKGWWRKRRPISEQKRRVRSPPVELDLSVCRKKR